MSFKGFFFCILADTYAFLIYQQNCSSSCHSGSISYIVVYLYFRSFGVVSDISLHCHSTWTKLHSSVPEVISICSMLSLKKKKPTVTIAAKCHSVNYCWLNFLESFMCHCESLTFHFWKVPIAWASTYLPADFIEVLVPIVDTACLLIVLQGWCFEIHGVWGS